MSRMPDNLKPFEFHNVLLTAGSGEWYKGDCFLCGKEGHFYVGSKTGQWNCKRCLERGNIASFLQKLWEVSYNTMVPTSDWEALAADRGLEIVDMQEWGICKSILSDEWIIPSHNPKNILSNLHRIVQVDGKWKSYATPQSPGYICKVWPFGTQLLKKEQKKLIVGEGPWDGIGIYGALKRLRKRAPVTEYEQIVRNLVRTINPKDSLIREIGVMAAPGAGGFPPEWLEFGAGRDMTLIYDSDHAKVRCGACKKEYFQAQGKCECGSAKTTGKVLVAGYDGMLRVCKVVNETPNKLLSMSHIMWGEQGFDPALKHGYDARDAIKDMGVLNGMRLLMERIKPYDLGSAGEESTEGEKIDHGQEIVPIERTSFSDLCADFESKLHFKEPLRDTLAICLATVISTEIPGEQIWMRVIGPPGSGKTTLAECISADKEHVRATSVFTGFHSGWRAGKGKKDFSLIKKLHNMTFVIKDADTLTSSPNRDKLLGEMRDMYDGVTRSDFKNGKGGTYEGWRTTMILCGTDDLRGLNRSFRGDRFLDIEIMQGTDAHKAFLVSATKSAYNDIQSFFSPENTDQPGMLTMTFLKSVTVGFIHHLKKDFKSQRPPRLSPETDEYLQCLGQLLAFMRARVKREGDELLYRPRIELGTRLAKQFVKLGVCLAIVLGRESVDEECLRIVRKIMKDTATGFPSEVMTMLAKNPEGSSCGSIALSLGLAESTTKRLLEDLAELRIIEKNAASNNSGVRGRKLHLWVLTEEVRKLWEVVFAERRKKPIMPKGKLHAARH